MNRSRTELVVECTTITVRRVSESYHETRIWDDPGDRRTSASVEPDPATDAKILPRRSKLLKSG